MRDYVREAWCIWYCPIFLLVGYRHLSSSSCRFCSPPVSLEYGTAVQTVSHLLHTII